MADHGIFNGLPLIWSALAGDSDLPDVRVAGAGDLPSAYAVSDLASAAVGALGAAVSEWMAGEAGGAPRVAVDRRLASHWFATSYRPDGWERPSSWDAVAGDYPAADGWIRLHTNAPHHRKAALSVLGVDADRDAVGRAVAGWEADALEAAVVAAGGCAAAMRTRAEWLTHPQGAAVATEPLIWREVGSESPGLHRSRPPGRPLSGVRVLDLTRVLAGPVSTRSLAGFGADVLRLDPPWWDEPGVLPDVTLGKRCARLDLASSEGRGVLSGLLRDADVLVHGYRSDALDRLGFSTEERQRIRPGLVDVSLDAYGWTGPWAARRGFDSLVQMSAGIAAEGMRQFRAERPTPLPVQALDHAAGYLMAACAVRGLTVRRNAGRGSTWRTSLARVAELLVALPVAADATPMTAMAPEDFARGTEEQTGWGPASRLPPPLGVEGAPMRWERPAGRLGTSPAAW